MGDKLTKKRAEKRTEKHALYFDEKNVPPDVWDVLRAASLLNIGEFRIFELAFKNWFGRQAREKTIERYFIPYMFRGRVPSWVRHFCREIIDLERMHHLDAEYYAFKPEIQTYAGIWKGLLGFIGIGATLLVLVLLAKSVAPMMPLACTFPPCY